MRHHREVSIAAEQAYPSHPGPRIGALSAWLHLLLGRLRLRSIAGAASVAPSEAAPSETAEHVTLGITGDPYRAATLFPFIPVRQSTDGSRARDKARKEGLS